MKRFKTVLAFMFGVSTMTIALWLVVDVRAQSGGPGAIDVCLAENGTLRVARPPATCPPGQKSLALMPDAQNAPQDAMDKSSRARLAELETRVSDLEDAASRGELGNKVVEPFTVLNEAEKPVFVVKKVLYGLGPAVEVSIINNEGTTVTGITASEWATTVYADSATANLHFGFGRQGTWSGLVMMENDKGRIGLGRTIEKSERYCLEVYAPDEKLVAGIGQSEGGGGLVTVAEHGVQKARMSLTDDTAAGTLGISRPGSGDIAVITEGASAGGLLRILSAKGVPMVEAVAGSGGYGVVGTGPGAFKSGAGLLGLPGSYIAGKPR